MPGWQHGLSFLDPFKGFFLTLLDRGAFEARADFKRL